MAQDTPSEFGDFIVYVDESGDHGLVSIDPNYPVFVLCFCIFRKDDYVNTVVPLMQRLKFRFFGHDSVVMHSHKIRKSSGEFSFLFSQPRRQEFIEAVNEVIEQSPFTLIASVIDKEQLKASYEQPRNPYDIAMTFCLERAHFFLQEHGQLQNLTHVVIERRGEREDRNLELAFRRVVQGRSYVGRMSFDIVFADKKANSTGLQIADLVARPIGTSVLRPDQPNRAFDIVRAKFRTSNTGRLEGYGLKVFPTKNERPR